MNSEATGKYCIVIGENLQTDKNFHLLIDKNGVKIDKIMTPDEYMLIVNVLVANSIIEPNALKNNLEPNPEQKTKEETAYNLAYAKGFEDGLNSNYN